MASNHKKPVLKDLRIDQLVRGRYQPRRQFDATELQDLADSIRSAGLLQPIVVRPQSGEQFEIVAGERRWRAAQLAKLESVPCLVNHFSDEQAAQASTIENINRVDLNPIEEAQAYQRLIDEFGYLHEEVAAAVGKSRVKITNALRLLKLDPRVQTLLVEKQLKEGHGKSLAALNPTQQWALAQKAIEKSWSVRQLEKAVKKEQAEKKTTASDKKINVEALERALSDHIGCPVKIDSHQTQGDLKIHFHDLPVLDGVLKSLGFKNLKEF